MKRIVSLLMAIIVFFMSSIPAMAIGECNCRKGVVVGGNVCLRKSYGYTTVLGFVQNGEGFDCLGITPYEYDQHLWRNVKMNQGANIGKKGWIALEYTRSTG
ncbi:MAG: hypothetical protein IK016_10670 [Lachnospiraceae bacterium]|nr:hypothetical protein [Lachnospiraceae bacterium]